MAAAEMLSAVSRISLRHQLESELAVDDLAQSDVGEGRTRRRLDERTMTLAQLSHSTRDDVDQELLVRDYFAGFLEELRGHIAQGTDGTSRFRRELEDRRRALCDDGWDNIRSEHQRRQGTGTLSLV
jgi:hypothetical protein